MGSGLNWSCVAASVAGSDHRRAGRGCDDAHIWRADSSTLVCAVADGAGSARLSKVGAQVAVSAAAGRALNQITGGKSPAGALVEAICFALDSLVATAATIGPTAVVGDLATTLLLATIGPHGFCAAQVGDGAIVVETEAGLELLTGERVSEYANITEFLTSPNLLDRIHIWTRIDQPSAIALMTDGVEHIAIADADRTPVEGFFRPLLERHRAGALPHTTLARFLASSNVARRTGDDVTLLLAAAP